MNLHHLIQPLADLAPEWATHFCVTSSGGAFWKDRLVDRASGLWLVGLGGTWQFIRSGDFPVCEAFAIDLTTGTIHLQQPDGTIIEVTQAEWSAMP